MEILVPEFELCVEGHVWSGMWKICVVLGEIYEKPFLKLKDVLHYSVIL